MKTAELQATLGITLAKLRELIKAGLPHKGRGKARVFEPAAVEQWLLATGRAEKAVAPSPAGLVARTIVEAAQLLAVAPRNFANWIKEPGFPGKPGTTGKRDGYFPIAEIENWRAARFGSDGRSGSTDDGERAVRREMLEIDRDRKLAELERDVLGTLIDAEETTRFIAFVIATAKSVLQELPDRVLAGMPSKISAGLRKVIRKVVLSVVRETLEHLSQLIKGDDDAKGDTE